MIEYEEIKNRLLKEPKVWLITGVAGFIGSNLLETLLKLNQKVIGLDDFSTGYQRNIDEVKLSVTSEQWRLFEFIEGDIRNLDTCYKACKNVDYVLHQAALGSVPRSIENPITTNEVNISGFLNMLISSRDCNVKRFVYAASSSTYGDSSVLPKVEDKIGKPLSPYAITKYVNELYADIFSRIYSLESIGLRYFNVFGRRQDYNGAYAAVIPKFIYKLIGYNSPTINGDGTFSRDFTYIDNVIQMNIMAALTEKIDSINTVYNVAAGNQITISQMTELLRDSLSKYDPKILEVKILYGPTRVGDIPHSLASINKAKVNLGYIPTHNFANGLKESIEWYWNYFHK